MTILWTCGHRHPIDCSSPLQRMLVFIKSFLKTVLSCRPYNSFLGLSPTFTLTLSRVALRSMLDHIPQTADQYLQLFPTCQLYMWGRVIRRMHRAAKKVDTWHRHAPTGETSPPLSISLYSCCFCGVSLKLHHSLGHAQWGVGVRHEAYLGAWGPVMTNTDSCIRPYCPLKCSTVLLFRAAPGAIAEPRMTKGASSRIGPYTGTVTAVIGF